MCAQGLFHERRPRAREAEHENRLRDLGAGPGAWQRAQALRDEELAPALDQLSRVIIQIGATRDFPQALLAGLEGAEGFLVLLHAIEQPPLLQQLPGAERGIPGGHLIESRD